MMTSVGPVGPAHSTWNTAPASGSVTTSNAASPVLLEPASVGTLPILGQLHLLMIRASQAKREADRNMQEQLEAAEAAADAERIQEMRERADKGLCWGLVSASLQVTTAVSSAMATGRELRAMANYEATVSRKAAEDAIEKSRAAMQRAAVETKYQEGIGQAVDGARTGLDAFARAEDRRAETRIAELEMAAKAARRDADRLKSEQEAAKEAEARVVQLAREIVQAQAACERAALLRI